MRIGVVGCGTIGTDVAGALASKAFSGLELSGVAVLSVVTPPVALASYTAAGIAGANANKVGFEAFRLTLAGFLVPFMFIYSPALILEGSTPQIILACITAIIGVVFLGCGLHRYCFGPLTWLQSALLLAAALLSLDSGLITDLLGLACAFIVFCHPTQRRALGAWWQRKRELQTA